MKLIQLHDVVIHKHNRYATYSFGCTCFLALIRPLNCTNNPGQILSCTSLKYQMTAAAGSNLQAFTPPEDSYLVALHLPGSFLLAM